MKRTARSCTVICGFVLLVACTLGLARTAVAESDLAFSVEPAIGFSSGYTKFIMDIHVLWDDEALGTVKSELEFPLGSTLAGLQLGLGPRDHRQKEWGVDLSVFASTTDPSGLMYDHDWRTDPRPGLFNGEFSYTESRVEMSSVLIVLEGHYAVKRSPAFSGGVTGGLRYQKFSQDIIGVEGWYYDSLGNRFEQSFSGLAMTYQVKYAMPSIGVYGTLWAPGGFDLTGKAMVAGVWASDEDDHVLRYRIATADGTGNAFIGGVKGRYVPQASGNRIFFEAELEYINLTARTLGEQYWYGDDPISEENDIGMRFNNIPHLFTSRQTYLSLRAGLSF